jgi:excisionase family DNA binding protein
MEPIMPAAEQTAPTKQTIEPEWESPTEAAERSGISRAWIYVLIDRGDIEARKMGTRTLIRVASRRAYLDSLPIAAADLRKPLRPKRQRRPKAEVQS